jgi:hypothetical protein
MKELVKEKIDAIEDNTLIPLLGNRGLSLGRADKSNDFAHMRVVYFRLLISHSNRKEYHESPTPSVDSSFPPDSILVHQLLWLSARMDHSISFSTQYNKA